MLLINYSAEKRLFISGLQKSTSSFGHDLPQARSVAMPIACEHLPDSTRPVVGPG
jgi:hypothetical protein